MARLLPETVEKGRFKKMAFVALCQTGELTEGQMVLFRVERKSVLLVWPSGGTIQAYRGRCPHQDVPLSDAHFDGKAVTCGAHHWCFDGGTGACLTPGGRGLKPYAVRLEAGEIQVDLA